LRSIVSAKYPKQLETTIAVLAKGELFIFPGLNADCSFLSMNPPFSPLELHCCKCILRLMLAAKRRAKIEGSGPPHLTHFSPKVRFINLPGHCCPDSTFGKFSFSSELNFPVAQAPAAAAVFHFPPADPWLSLCQVRRT